MALLAGPTADAPAPGDEAMHRFLHAPTADERAAAARQVIASEMPVDRALQALRRGRSYSPEAPGRRIVRTRMGRNGLSHPYMILIPSDYDPTRPTPVQLNLHGGMGAPEWPADGSWAAGWGIPQGEIVVLPAGWWDSMWWEASQADNIDTILAEVQRTWNVAENRVIGYGNSDGGAGVFFLAFKTPDRFAAYAAHVGPPDRLTRADFRVDGQMHLSNLRGQRFHLVHGEDDPKVPIQHLRKYLELFEKHDAVIDSIVLPGQGHSLTLTDEYHRRLGRFLTAVPRDPLPDTLTWATEAPGRYARRAWLVIDELALPDRLSEEDRSNLLPRWGTPVQMHGATVARKPWGRVELKREGNVVHAQAHNVKRFTLLVSPEEFDLSRPLTVHVNGEQVFHGELRPSLEVLLRWAERDDDRTKLFVAELSVTLPIR